MIFLHSLSGTRVGSSWSAMRSMRFRPVLDRVHRWLEDAIVLAKCLRDIPEPSQAFATYERLRRARDERMVQYGRNVSHTKVMTNPIQVWFRDLSIPLIFKLFANPVALDWIYSYKVDWDEPVV